jgi:exopolysaccharide production protein ExoZ
MQAALNIKTDSEVRKKLNLIQALRGIAAILVVCYHTGTLYSKNLNWLVFNNTFKFGHTGVNFFFVLSGFIIYYIHYKDLGKPSQLPSFIYKRFTRIFPVYWVILIVKLFAKHIDIFSIVLAFFLIPVKEAYITVSWTLSYEIFFYTCFGVLIYCLNKYTKILFSILGSVIFIRIIAIVAGYNVSFENFYLSFLFNPHIIEFIMGVLAGYIIINEKGKKWRYWLFTGGIIMFCISSLFTVLLVNDIADKMNAVPFQQAEKISCFLEINSFIFFCIPCFLIVAGAAMIDLSDNIKIPNLFLKIGDASYSIYLVHAIIVNIITLKLKSLNVEFINYTIIPTIIIAISLGYALHLTIEKPLLNFFHNNYERFNKTVLRSGI